jgi:hypothetical protein
VQDSQKFFKLFFDLNVQSLFYHSVTEGKKYLVMHIIFSIFSASQAPAFRSPSETPPIFSTHDFSDHFLNFQDILPDQTLSDRKAKCPSKKILTGSERSGLPSLYVI